MFIIRKYYRNVILIYFIIEVRGVKNLNSLRNGRIWTVSLIAKSASPLYTCSGGPFQLGSLEWFETFSELVLEFVMFRTLWNLPYPDEEIVRRLEFLVNKV